MLHFCAVARMFGWCPGCCYVFTRVSCVVAMVFLCCYWWLPGRYVWLLGGCMHVAFPCCC